MHIESLTPAQFDQAIALWHETGLTRPWNDPVGDLRRAMMRACETWLSARDVPKVDLMVRTGNGAVLAFYDAIGYGRDDVFVMSKRLR